MGKDTVEKRLEEYEDVFADIFDNLLFGGAGIVKAEELIATPASAYTRQQDGSIRGGMRDVRMENRKQNCFRLICGIENQSEVDNTMPERVMGYEFADYESQIKRIMASNKKQKKPAGSKRIYKKQKLNPVITGVLYYGEKEWRYPLRLHEMLKFPEELKEKIKPLVADYPMNLIQVARLTEEERSRLKSDFRIVAEYLACRDDKVKWEKFICSEKEILHVEELLDVLEELSNDNKFLAIKEKIKQSKRRKEKWTMCKIMDYAINKGREEGICAMIQDNLDMGQERETIVEKVVRYFSVSKESAAMFYERVIAV